MTFVHDLKITFSLNRVLRMHGIRDNSAPPKKVKELSKELLEMVNRDCLLEPAIAYDFLAVCTTEHERIFFARRNIAQQPSSLKATRQGAGNGHYGLHHTPSLGK